MNTECEIEKCNKNIMGNLLLADSSWNRGMGQLCWEQVKVEKSQVYGPIFYKAMNNVRKCCGLDTLTPTVIDTPSSKHDDTKSSIYFLLYASGLFIAIVVLFGGYLCYTKKRDNDYRYTDLNEFDDNL